MIINVAMKTDHLHFIATIAIEIDENILSELNSDRVAIIEQIQQMNTGKSVSYKPPKQLNNDEFSEKQQLVFHELCTLIKQQKWQMVYEKAIELNTTCQDGAV